MLGVLESGIDGLYELNEEVLEAVDGGAGGPGGVANGFEAYVAGVLLAAENMYKRSRLTIIDGRRSWNYKTTVRSMTWRGYSTSKSGIVYDVKG
jgi:H+/Cl- antiporter ClcA